jgi:hypothetical protein
MNKILCSLQTILWALKQVKVYINWSGIGNTNTNTNYDEFRSYTWAQEKKNVIEKYSML